MGRTSAPSNPLGKSKSSAWSASNLTAVRFQQLPFSPPANLVAMLGPLVLLAALDPLALVGGSLPGTLVG